MMRLRLLLLFLVLLTCAVAARGQSTPGTVKYPPLTDDLDSLIRTANNAHGNLSAEITAGSTSFTLSSGAALFPSTGAVAVDNEILYYTSKSGSTFSGLLRGQDGTVAASHSLGALVQIRLVSRHHTVLADALIAVETKYPGNLTGLLVSVGTNPVSAVPAPTGAVVGTSDTQVLSNKTINASNNTISNLASSHFSASALNGNGTKFQMFTGTYAANDCIKFDANGNAVSAGAPCGSGPGGGGTDATIVISDITTNNASTLAHGFLPKLSGNVSDVFRGNGTWGAGGAGGTDYSQGSTTSGQVGPLVQGAVTTSAPSYTNGQTSPISLTPGGLVRTALGDTLDKTNDEVRQAGTAGNAFPTAVANAAPASAFYDLNGRQVVAPYSNPENYIQGITAAITGTTDTQVLAAAGTGLRNYVTSLIVVNSHGTVGTVVECKDGSTVIFRSYAGAVGGGFSITFPVPLKTTANTAFNCANVTTGANTYVTAVGYRAP